MTRTSFPAYIFAAVLTTAGSGFSHAEEIAVPIGTKRGEAVAMPGRAWTQTEVQDKFGSPIAQHGPVGLPPITTWEYSEFSVYFEHNKVIHSVRAYEN